MLPQSHSYGIISGMSPAKKPKRELKKPPALRQLSPEELKAWRLKYDLSQAELAELLGVRQSAISRWESGIHAIPPYLALALKYLEENYFPL